MASSRYRTVPCARSPCSQRGLTIFGFLIAAAVVVIFARVTEAGYNDKSGNPVPETVVEGSGRAVIFNGGNATEATWKKAASDSTMTFTSKNGNTFGLKPGHVWLEAVPRGGAVTY